MSCWCMQKILFINLSPFPFHIALHCFASKSILWFLFEIIKWVQTASLAFSGDVGIHRMSRKFWNCINFELALLSYCDDFSSRLIGHQRRLNSMWHKTKLLVAHEYFKALQQLLHEEIWNMVTSELIYQLKWKYLMGHGVTEFCHHGWRFNNLRSNYFRRRKSFKTFFSFLSFLYFFVSDLSEFNKCCYTFSSRKHLLSLPWWTSWVGSSFSFFHPHEYSCRVAETSCMLFY